MAVNLIDVTGPDIRIFVSGLKKARVLITKEDKAKTPKAILLFGFINEFVL